MCVAEHKGGIHWAFCAPGRYVIDLSDPFILDIRERGMCSHTTLIYLPPNPVPAVIPAGLGYRDTPAIVLWQGGFS